MPIAAQPNSSAVRTAAVRWVSIERVNGNRILATPFGTVICHSRFRPTLALWTGGTSGVDRSMGMKRLLPTTSLR